jgi:hypothetical protein
MGGTKVHATATEYLTIDFVKVSLSSGGNTLLVLAMMSLKRQFLPAAMGANLRLWFTD